MNYGMARALMRLVRVAENFTDLFWNLRLRGDDILIGA